MSIFIWITLKITLIQSKIISVNHRTMFDDIQITILIKIASINIFRLL